MFRKVWKFFRQSGKFPESLETFQTVQKVSSQAGKFLYSMESSRTVWKVMDSQESFQMVLFPPDCLHYCCNIHILHFCKKSFDVFVAKAIYALLARVCRESDLRTFAAYMSRKQFTHSVRKVFAREILPTGKF